MIPCLLHRQLIHHPYVFRIHILPWAPEVTHREEYTSPMPQPLCIHLQGVLGAVLICNPAASEPGARRNKGDE